MKADRVLLQYVFEGVIRAFSKRAHISLRKSLDLFYKSELYTEISEGISDMHCRSDEYLAEELRREVEGNTGSGVPQ
ncbi:MAG: DUF3791 domain-containing protein [Treponema sp.]|jgi:hypothetical protein|nr:DUF3791 domain-containing protein [Treponema sp.]